MINKWLFLSIWFVLLVFMFPILVGATTAAPNSEYAINNWTVDGGGGYSHGGDYTLQGTVGQHDAGFLQGGDYALQGGFWFHGVQEILDFLIHLPLVLR